MARPMIRLNSCASPTFHRLGLGVYLLNAPKPLLTEGGLPFSRISSEPIQSRKLHTKRHVSSSAFNLSDSEVKQISSEPLPALSCLPWTTLIRSYLITAVSSIPALLKPSISVLSFLANSKSSLFNPDSNPILRALLKHTFYVQFCAGENAKETHRTIDSLKSMGYSGVILGHAREVVLSKKDEAGLGESSESATQNEVNTMEISQWKNSTLETVQLAQKGDFVALKFTGAGRQALRHLKATTPCAPELREAIHEICQLAQNRGVGLLFDAEQASLQQGIDNWTIYFMKHYNRENATVYGTYQAYAKRTPELLALHLAEAQQNDFVLGVKLVRGAYMGSDPRELFWDNIEETHECYNALAQCIIERQYGGMLHPADANNSSFPRVGLVLASHNAESVQKARAIRDRQAQAGIERIPLAYGQLMGMADHVSCQLVQKAKERGVELDRSVEVPQAYKYLVHGSLGECMQYLLRRARENQDAVSRTIDARRALGKELVRRLGFSHD